MMKVQREKSAGKLNGIRAKLVGLRDARRDARRIMERDGEELDQVEQKISEELDAARAEIENSWPGDSFEAEDLGCELLGIAARLRKLEAWQEQLEDRVERWHAADEKFADRIHALEEKLPD